ncbi:cytochrome c/c1 heme-lyase [Gorgonomyces haynaldii]|nr:cytochrome c/c1 heme-lyase [Gorgonomyces haynaldii]
MMPHLTQDMAEGQKMRLSVERTESSIPKEEKQNWEYPSPQQFYNALKRKGKEAPEEAIDMMVDIHNFLNEESWNEILRWEKKYHCDCNNVKLEKFMGKPDQLSPLARFYMTVYG